MKDEIGGLINKLLEQEKILLLVITEAEERVKKYQKALTDGRLWLSKVEDELEKVFGPRPRMGDN